MNSSDDFNMEECPHGNSAPVSMLADLHETQGGTGRHRCPICAYSEGMKVGITGSQKSNGRQQRCTVDNEAPQSLLAQLPESQGGTGRHLCTICAYADGTRDGLAQWTGHSSWQTAQITHGGAIEAFIPDEEGRKSIREHVHYERSSKNRARAVEIHGTACAVCGMSFDEVYGTDLARGYIEIHHVRSITEQDEQVVAPETDLVPLCSNCHSMVHRRPGQILGLDELKAIMSHQC